jgi:hypothetical protein
MARGQVGQGNIVSHGRSAHGIGARPAGKPQVAREGTLFAGLRKPIEVIVLVVTLLAYGCPIQAIEHAFGLDERTVAAWRDRAGTHCRRVHEAIIELASLDLVQGPTDELRVKGRMVVWNCISSSETFKCHRQPSQGFPLLKTVRMKDTKKCVG